MPRQYQVYEVLPTGAISETEIVLAAATPEDAARLALGESLRRGGHKAQLRAKVYTTDTTSGVVTMVRLYAVDEAPRR